MNNIFEIDVKELLEDKASDAVESLFEDNDIAKLALAQAAAKKASIQQRNIRTFGKINKIRKAIRGGKIVNNLERSNKKGWKILNGKAIKMSFAEKRRRKLAARIATRKRRAKQSIINMKMHRSLIKHDRMLGI